MIRVIRCCDSFSWEYWNPGEKTQNNTRGNWVCSIKGCKNKKINGRCNLQTIRFKEDHCLDMEEKEKCPICKRTPSAEGLLEKHHLKPKCKKGKDTILVCTDCGDQIHQLFTNKELAKEYNTPEKLLAHPKIQAWAEWVKNKKFGICMKSKKRK